VTRGCTPGSPTAGRPRSWGGGPKLCAHGCMGLGSCERSCPFDAVHVGEDGLAHVDRGRCTGCGNCVEACPKRIIDLMPASELV